MPCYYDDSGERDMRARENSEALDLTTRLLCELGPTLSAAQIAKVKGLKEWLTKHKRMDEERIKREKAAKEAQLKQAKKALDAAERRYKFLKNG